MTKELLLRESIIFKGSNIIDNIHQSLIDLETDHSIEDVEVLLKKSFSYLDQKLDDQTASELFSLIISCFLKYPKSFTDNFQYLLKTSKSNANQIIITASSIVYMINTQQKMKING